MEDNQRTNKRKADEGEEGAQNTGAGEAGGAAQEGQQQKQQNDLEPPATKRARTDDEQERRRAGKGKQKDDDDHDGGYARRPVERHQDEAHVTMGEGGGHGGDNDEERAMELERQREGEEEDRRAARRATSRFQQTFREDAEFGRLDYTNVGDRKRGDQEALEGEEEARGEASLADEQAHGSGYTLKGKEVPIEPFNLSEDLEMGYFDATGNFVFTRRDKDGDDDDDVGDEMGNLSKEHRADALQADAWLRDSETLATTRAVPSRAPPAAPVPEEEEEVDLLELKRKVCEVLLPEETVQQALQRLGKTIKLARAAQGKGRGRGKGSSTDPADEATKQKAAEHLAESRRKLDLVTTAASKLFDDGWVNIYDYTRERVLHSLLDSHDSKPQQSLLGSSSSSSSSSSGNARQAESQATAASGVTWEYKQSEEGELYGPYSTEQMAAWYDDGFFRGESVALVRRIGENEFVRSDTIDFRQELSNATAREQ